MTSKGLETQKYKMLSEEKKKEIKESILKTQEAKKKRIATQIAKNNMTKLMLKTGYKHLKDLINNDDVIELSSINLVSNDQSVTVYGYLDKTYYLSIAFCAKSEKDMYSSRIAQSLCGYRLYNKTDGFFFKEKINSKIYKKSVFEQILLNMFNHKILTAKTNFLSKLTITDDWWE